MKRTVYTFLIQLSQYLENQKNLQRIINIRDSKTKAKYFVRMGAPHVRRWITVSKQMARWEGCPYHIAISEDKFNEFFTLFKFLLPVKL